MEPYYSDEQVTIWNADALALPIQDEAVDLICTSPPYFGLRSYQDGGEHYDGQIGSEATPREFIDALIAATREMVRVLKPSGSIWVNLGDRYASGKSLIGVPWRYALRCIDDLGLILRAEVIWSKPNGLPESVTDRVRRSHETWFHFTKEPRYFSAVDEIREQYEQNAHAAGQWKNGQRRLVAHPSGESSGALRGSYGAGFQRGYENPLGKLPGSVWEIPTQPLIVPPHLGVDHFAAFPMEWPRRIIRGWSPSGICIACGQGRRPVVDRTTVDAGGAKGRSTCGSVSVVPGQPDGREGARRAMVATIVGEACACPDTSAPTRPAVVLDPFGGTGTVALVARSLGRIGWHVDLSRDYCRLAQWRVTDPGEIARAMQVEKPDPVAADQGSLLDLLA